MTGYRIEDRKKVGIAWQPVPLGVGYDGIYPDAEWPSRLIRRIAAADPHVYGPYGTHRLVVLTATPDGAR
jgi:hypothetical protein